MSFHNTSFPLLNPHMKVVAAAIHFVTFFLSIQFVFSNDVVSESEEAPGIWAKIRNSWFRSKPEENHKKAPSMFRFSFMNPQESVFKATKEETMSQDDEQEENPATTTPVTKLPGGVPSLFSNCFSFDDDEDAGEKNRRFENLIALQQTSFLDDSIAQTSGKAPSSEEQPFVINSIVLSEKMSPEEKHERTHSAPLRMQEDYSSVDDTVSFGGASSAGTIAGQLPLVTNKGGYRQARKYFPQFPHQVCVYRSEESIEMFHGYHDLLKTGGYLPHLSNGVSISIAIQYDPLCKPPSLVSSIREQAFEQELGQTIGHATLFTGNVPFSSQDTWPTEVLTTPGEVSLYIPSRCTYTLVSLHFSLFKEATSFPECVDGDTLKLGLYYSWGE